MKKETVNRTTFTKRPCIGSRYLSPDQQVLEVAASWPSGVVFEGGPTVKIDDLRINYTPQCAVCKTYHMPEQPHAETLHFTDYFFKHFNQIATYKDTFAHCKGTIKQAAELAKTQTRHSSFSHTV